jgi:hypothetical protein
MTEVEDPTQNEEVFVGDIEDDKSEEEKKADPIISHRTDPKRFEAFEDDEYEEDA